MSEDSGRPWAMRTERDRRDTATHAALLDAGEQLFSERGFKETSVAQIAERAGVSRATFYVYFASRAEVIHALSQRVRDEITEVQRAAGRQSDNPEVVIESAMRAGLGVYSRHSRILTVIQHQALADEEVADVWEQIVRAPAEVDARFIAMLRTDYRVKPAAPDGDIAEVVTAAMLRFAALAARDPHRLTELGDALIAMYHRLVGLPT